MIDSVLIANRGEIACRIIRTCQRLGIRSVAVFSDADRQARHVQLAGEAIRIGPAPAEKSYLNGTSILEAARRSGVESIHPGYGFLAENSAFAQACRDESVVFIGPTAKAIHAMGQKQVAKELAVQAGVPVIPGYFGSEQSDEKLQAEAERLGYPLMVKATDGGGGKGMRLVTGADQLAEALSGARREAKQAFGSDGLMLERPLANPRHIEVQVFGDHHGHIIHLGERDCSIQRRYQKIIEESPAPGLSPEMRQQLGEAAVKVARAIDYVNAGTVEFLLDEDGQFYFLEMNTRLQVEHPVTEMVAGCDLVAWQIAVAEGRPLPWTQEQVKFQGHAIEARVYAENAAIDFLPVTGHILLWQEPEMEGVRIDSGLQQGDDVTIHYDPLLAKIIAHGPDRQTAVRRLARALESCLLLGITSNVSFLRDVLKHEAFLSGAAGSAFVSDHFSGWKESPDGIVPALITATLAQFAPLQSRDLEGYWRNNPNRPQRYSYQLPGSEELVDVDVTQLPGLGNAYRLDINEQSYEAELVERQGANWVLTVDGCRQQAVTACQGDGWWIQTRAGASRLRAVSLLRAPARSAVGGSSLRAPMPGAVLSVLVEVGQMVSKGQALLKLEAMKMEHTIRAPDGGVVEAIYYAPGDTVDADALLLQLDDLP